MGDRFSWCALWPNCSTWRCAQTPGFRLFFPPALSFAQSNPKLMPLAQLDAPKVDASKLNSKKAVELMTQAGLL